MQPRGRVETRSESEAKSEIAGNDAHIDVGDRTLPWLVVELVRGDDALDGERADPGFAEAFENAPQHIERRQMEEALGAGVSGVDSHVTRPNIYRMISTRYHKQMTSRAGPSECSLP